MSSTKRKAGKQGAAKESVEYEEVPLEDGGYKRRRVGSKYWQRMCEHGKEKKTCKECGGKGLCEHGRRRSRCKECGGKGVCEHGRQRYECKECGGKGICEHGRQRSKCKECGGKGFCEHGRQRSRCKECKAPTSQAQGRGPSEEGAAPPPITPSITTVVI